MTKPTAQSIAETTLLIFNALEQHDVDEQEKVLSAVQSLLGNTLSPIPAGPSPQMPSSIATPPAQTNSGPDESEESYFAHKGPQNKIEELAVAAHYLEKSSGKTGHTREAIKSTIESARRNFDAKNFKRDMNNAKTRGLFNKGGTSGEYTLSFYGKNYIDALPDRDTAAAIRAPKKVGGKKKAKKKAVKSK